MKLKVKELRDYLHLHHVSTHLCREKEELVELVLGHQSSSSEASTPESAPPPLTTPTASQNTPVATQVTPTSSPTTPNNVEALPRITLSQPQTSPTEAQVQPPEPPLVQTETSQEQEEEDEEEPSVEGAARRRASLSDLKSEADIEDLSVMQLKEILARNFVDYKGCCERWELQERVRRLYKDKANLQQAVDGPPAEELLCRICMDSPIDCVLLECGHMITCTNCGKRMSECPICRQYVVRAVHVFRS